MYTICHSVTSASQDLKQFVNCYENVDKHKTCVTITCDFLDRFILKMDLIFTTTYSSRQFSPFSTLNHPKVKKSLSVMYSQTCVK